MKKILILDDQLSSLTVAASVLNKPKIELTTCLDPLEVSAFLSVNEPAYDLIVVDWNMPNLNGFEALKYIDDFYAGMKLLVPYVIFSGEEFNKMNIPDTENLFLMDMWPKSWRIDTLNQSANTVLSRIWGGQ